MRGYVRKGAIFLLALTWLGSASSQPSQQASFQVELRDPASAGQIVNGLCEISGRRLVIEEASPDELRMRLRLSELDAEHADGGAHPERRPRS